MKMKEVQTSFRVASLKDFNCGGAGPRAVGEVVTHRT
jgi:hypothetical protein